MEIRSIGVGEKWREGGGVEDGGSRVQGADAKHYIYLPVHHHLPSCNDNSKHSLPHNPTKTQLNLHPHQQT